MYLFSGKKIKVNIKYEENNAQFELYPYDTLSNLKVYISRFFPQITFDPILFHQKKILNELHDMTRISELSHGKNSLNLHIAKPLKPQTPIIVKENYYSQQNTNTNLIQINSTSRNNNTLNKDLKCKCLILSIDYYCSQCHEFLCAKCKEETHTHHKAIVFDVTSIDESVKLFAISLQAEISNELRKYKKIQTMFKENLLIDFQSWKEMIIRKLDKIETFYRCFEEFEAIFQTKYGTIEHMSMDATNKIEKIITDFISSSKGNQKNNFTKAKGFCHELTNSIEIIEFLKNENKTRQEEFDTNNQISEMFTQLDCTIDKLEMLSKRSYDDIRKRTENEMIKTKTKIIIKKKTCSNDDNENMALFNYINQGKINKEEGFQRINHNSANNMLTKSQEYHLSLKPITEREIQSKIKKKLRVGRLLNKNNCDDIQIHTQSDYELHDMSNDNSIRHKSQGKKKLQLPQISAMMTKE